MSPKVEAAQSAAPAARRPTTIPAARSRRANPAKRLAGPAKRIARGKRGAETGERRLLEQRVERGAERRAGLPQLVVAPAQSLVRRQARQKGGSAAVVELVVDQGDKFGVVVGHREAARALLFQFRQRRPSSGEPAHDRADRHAERRRRLGVTVAFGVDQQERFALRLGEAANRS